MLDANRDLARRMIGDITIGDMTVPRLGFGAMRQLKSDLTAVA